jgi:hypothetical protein
MEQPIVLKAHVGFVHSHNANVEFARALSTWCCER